MTSFRFGTSQHPTPSYFAQLRRLLQQPDDALEQLLGIARNSDLFDQTAEIDAIIGEVEGADPHVLAGALPGLQSWSPI